jgi:hypothetical protein
MPWRDLACDGLAGIELWSFVTDTAESLERVGDVLRFIFTPERLVDHPPRQNLAAWDRLCRARPVVALGGLDAHQLGKRIGGRVPFRLMSYARSFRHLHTHVLCEEEPTGELDQDRDQVYAALRAGRCYLAMDSVAPARGFAFWAEGPDGAVPMGAETRRSGLTLLARFPRPASFRLVRDGEELAAGRGDSLEHGRVGPGVYRVEARREAHGAERTWILSNPIYVR